MILNLNHLLKKQTKEDKEFHTLFLHFRMLCRPMMTIVLMKMHGWLTSLGYVASIRMRVILFMSTMLMSGTTNNSIGCTGLLCMFFEVLGTLLSCVLSNDK